jgi:metallo-beta-lactamase family protein
MCEGGRVTHHLIHSIENEDNMIVMTGFQARGTLGRAILERAKTVRIFHDEYRVRAQVYFMGGLSAHADGDDLKEYIHNVSSARLQHVYLVHGDIEEATALKDSLARDTDLAVTIPQSMTMVTI